MSIRSALYTAARLLGDANALARGRVFQRIFNRVVWRTITRFIPWL